MMLIVINGIIYFIYGCFEYFYFDKITPFSFTILFYVVPIVINTVFCVMYIKKDQIKVGRMVSPFFSVISYLLLGYISQTNGLWERFVHKYTVDTGEVSVSIDFSMITSSQIFFVILLYLGLNYLAMTMLLKKGVEDEYVKN